MIFISQLFVAIIILCFKHWKYTEIDCGRRLTYNTWLCDTPSTSVSGSSDLPTYMINLKWLIANI